jgi:hypothetical protein
MIAEAARLIIAAQTEHEEDKAPYLAEPFEVTFAELFFLAKRQRICSTGKLP